MKSTKLRILVGFKLMRNRTLWDLNSTEFGMQKQDQPSVTQKSQASCALSLVRRFVQTDSHTTNNICKRIKPINTLMDCGLPQKRKKWCTNT